MNQLFAPDISFHPESKENQITFDDNFMLKVQKILDAEDGLNLYWLEV